MTRQFSADMAKTIIQNLPELPCLVEMPVAADLVPAVTVSESLLEASLFPAHWASEVLKF